MPFPSPGHLPHPGTEPTSLKSPALAGGFFTTSATWEVPYPQRLGFKLPYSGASTPGFLRLFPEILTCKQGHRGAALIQKCNRMGPRGPKGAWLSPPQAIAGTTHILVARPLRSADAHSCGRGWYPSAGLAGDLVASRMRHPGEGQALCPAKGQAVACVQPLEEGPISLPGLRLSITLGLEPLWPTHP